MAVTLLQLRTRSYRRADKEGDPHVGSSELNDLIDEGYTELWDRLLLANPHYFDTAVTFTVAASASSQVISSISGISAAGLQAVVTLQRKGVSGVYDAPLPQLMPGERGNVNELSYEVVAGSILFEPTGQPVTVPTGDYKLWYVPKRTVLTLDADTIDTRIPPGWEEYIICHAAAVMLGKEESSTKDVLARKDEIGKRIDAMSENIIVAQPKRVSDVRSARRFRFMSRTGYPVE